MAQALRARPEWLEQQFFHIGGRRHPGHHRRSQFNAQGLDKRGPELNGVQVVAEKIMPLAAVVLDPMRFGHGQVLRHRDASVADDLAHFA